MTTNATLTESEANAAPPAQAGPRPYQMDVGVYDRLVNSGVFGDRSPVYLWKGQLVEPMTKGNAHEFAVGGLNQSLVLLSQGGWHVRPATPVRVRDDSEPEPDLVVVRGANRDYRGRKPGAGDVALMVEVSDSSLAHDSGEKRDVYAAAMIPVYWVVNIPDQCIDVYARPTGPVERPGYEECRRFGPGDEVPVVLDGVEVGKVAVKDVLP